MNFSGTTSSLPPPFSKFELWPRQIVHCILSHCYLVLLQWEVLRSFSNPHSPSRVSLNSVFQISEIRSLFSITLRKYGTKIQSQYLKIIYSYFSYHVRKVSITSIYLDQSFIAMHPTIFYLVIHHVIFKPLSCSHYQMRIVLQFYVNKVKYYFNDNIHQFNLY